MRKTHEGGGTYDAILPAFRKLADSRNQQNYYVRGTYTHYNTIVYNIARVSHFVRIVM